MEIAMSTESYTFKNRTLNNRFTGQPRPVGDVEVVINWDDFIRIFGSKAANNRTGKTRLAHGAVTVKFRRARTDEAARAQAAS
jgi:hypothetical protein